MSKRLLLADDSITIQKVIGITFANEDYELVVVDNGDAALKKALEKRPDLILADVYMPGKNGYELCAAVKSEASLQGVPVLLLAGTFEPFDEAKALSAGADAWISKPFESQALIDKVEGLLARPAVTAPAPVASAPPVPPPAPRTEPVAPAAAAAPPVVEKEDELAADDIWGDMGEDIFAEEKPVVAATSETADDDLWGALSADDFGDEVPEAFAPAVTPEVPSASEGDDLWGALDDEMAEPAIAADDADFSFDEAPVADFGAVVKSAADTAQVEEEDIFSLDEVDILAEEDIELLEETSIGADDFEFDDNRAEDVVPEPDQIDVSAVATESPVSSTEDELDWGDLAEPSEMAQMYESFEEELTPPPMPPVAPEPAPAPAAKPEPPQVAAAPTPQPAPSPAPPVAPVPMSAPAAAPVERVEQAVAALSEEQLSAIVERVAASMLEKIAWEVVPDLAESLIKEELRKIREEAG